MLWIADRPAAHAWAKLHKVDRDRLGERRRTIPTCPVDNDLKGGLPPIVEPAIACGSLKRAGDFGHFCFRSLFVGVIISAPASEHSTIATSDAICI